MGDKLRKFKIDRQQEKHPFRPKRERPVLDDEDVFCNGVRYQKKFESDCPEPKENENET